jgi:hypothetical protein
MRRRAAAVTLIIGTLAVVAGALASLPAAASPRRSGVTTLKPAYTIRVYGSSVTRGRITRGSISVGAVFRIPGVKSSRPAASAADSTRNCANDSSGSVSSCLTQNFEACQVGSIQAIELDSYVQRWTSLDPGSELVQLTGPAGIRAEVTGITDARKCGGPTHGYPVTVQTRKLRRPHYGRYVFRPKFSGRKGGYVAISGPASQCANSYVEVKRYRERWKLETPNVCQGTFFTPGSP